MISRVSIRNYRSLSDVDIHLNRLTVLVGQNGSGKSNFVDALRFISDAVSMGLDSAITMRHGIEAVRRWSPSRPRNVLIDLDFCYRRDRDPSNVHIEGTYSLELKNGTGGDYSIKREYFRAKAQESSEEFEVVAGKVVRSNRQDQVGRQVPPKSLSVPLWPGFATMLFCHYIAESRYYTIFPDALREPQRVGGERSLNSHGENLAVVLRSMEQAGSKRLNEISAALSTIVGGICDVNVKPVSGYLVIRFCHRSEDGRKHWFDAFQESDGTLRLLGIATALYQIPTPPLVVIEEPELTVHPGALGVIRDIIKEVSSQRTQVIITTHSPDLLESMDADTIRVVDMTCSGTQIGPIDRQQKTAIADRLFSPGELVRYGGLHRQQ